MIVRQIKEIFARGLLPAAAYRQLLRQLRNESKDDFEYHKRITDRSQTPRSRLHRYLHGVQERAIWMWKPINHVSALEERINNLKAQDKEYVLTFQNFDEAINQPIIVAIITFLMKRVHKLVIFNILKLTKIS